MITRRTIGRVENLVHNIADSFDDLDCKAHSMAKTLGISKGVIEYFTIEISVQAKLVDGRIIPNAKKATCHWSGSLLPIEPKSTP